MAAFKSLPLNLTLSATSWPWSFVVPCTCTGRPGIRDVMAICFFRAFKTPCTSSTSVVGVSNTTSLGVSTVCSVMVAPLRPLITPWTVWPCIAALPAKDYQGRKNGGYSGDGFCLKIGFHGLPHSHALPFACTTIFGHQRRQRYWQNYKGEHKRLTGDGDRRKLAPAGKTDTPSNRAGAAWSVFYLDPGSIASLFVLCVGV